MAPALPGVARSDHYEVRSGLALGGDQAHRAARTRAQSPAATQRQEPREGADSDAPRRVADPEACARAELLLRREVHPMGVRHHSLPAGTTRGSAPARRRLGRAATHLLPRSRWRRAEGGGEGPDGAPPRLATRPRHSTRAFPTACCLLLHALPTGRSGTTSRAPARSGGWPRPCLTPRRAGAGTLTSPPPRSPAPPSARHATRQQQRQRRTPSSRPARKTTTGARPGVPLGGPARFGVQPSVPLTPADGVPCGPVNRAAGM